MSEESKEKISLKLKGRVLSEDHRLKISKAMMGNTNRSKKNSPLFIDDLYNDYANRYADESIGVWITSVRKKLMTCSGIFSNKKLFGYSFTELSVEDIDQFHGNDADPELLLLVSEIVSGFKDE